MVRSTYLMAGGAPVGIKMPTPDLGWRTNMISIKTTTRQGNRSTTPKGMEKVELPFKRIGLLKNAHLGDAFVFFFTSSSEGRGGDAGMRFKTRCTKPIEAVEFALSMEDYFIGPPQIRGQAQDRLDCYYNAIVMELLNRTTMI